MKASSLIFVLLIAVQAMVTAHTLALKFVDVERDSLMALYDRTDGVVRSHNTGWGTAIPHCDWYGVVCDVDHVITPIVSSNELNGPIPSALSNLSGMQYLHLSGARASITFLNEPINSPPKIFSSNTGWILEHYRPDHVFKNSVLSPETTNMHEQHWVSMHNLFNYPYWGQVVSLAVNSRGTIFAGGFAHLSHSGVYKWDGSSWSNIFGGSGIGGCCTPGAHALAFDQDDNLYVGGRFDTIEGIVVNNIAMWDGTNIWSLGSGTDLTGVYALAIDAEGNLYVGGRFTTAGGEPANNIAMWDGTSWSALGDGMDGSVRALVYDKEGNLYVGGRFTTAGGELVNYIAMWDGTSWSALGDGMDGPVSALVLDNDGGLFAGGRFLTAGGLPANNIARWDGSGWSALDSGIVGPDGADVVNTLAIDSDDNLYAGGHFTIAGGASANHVAVWDKSNWSEMGSGMGGYMHPKTGIEYYPLVNALAVDHLGVLYAGGAFMTAGDVPTTNVAMWINLPYGTYFPGVSK